MLALQELIARQTMDALEMVFRAARHMPENKLRWSPAEGARSAHAILCECAAAPLIHIPLLSGDGNPYAGAPMAVYQERITALESAEPEEVYREALDRHPRLIGLIRAFPTEKLAEMRSVPYGPDAKLSNADVLAIPYWNLVYHIGQINYIQTLYGDMEFRI